MCNSGGGLSTLLALAHVTHFSLFTVAGGILFIVGFTAFWIVVAARTAHGA